jgi:hypothetical protein
LTGPGVAKQKIIFKCVDERVNYVHTDSVLRSAKSSSTKDVQHLSEWMVERWRGRNRTGGGCVKEGRVYDTDKGIRLALANEAK